MTEKDLNKTNGGMDYWLRILGGELPLLDLPSTKPRPKIKTSTGFGLSTYISMNTSKRLRIYSEENEGNLFMVLVAAWNILMCRYTSQKDIIIGAFIEEKEHTNLAKDIDFYSGAVVLRNAVNEKESFNVFFQKIKDNIIQSYNHRIYPYDKLVEELGVQKNESRDGIFDVMLVFRNGGETIKSVKSTDRKKIEIIELGFCTSKFDIELSFHEEGNYISVHLVYNPDIYDRVMIDGIIRHYKRLLDLLLESPEENISQADFMFSEEKQKLLVMFNSTVKDYSFKKTMHDLFGEQVLRTPDHVALVYNDHRLNYKELDEISNQLGHYLQNNYKIRPDDLIGIKLERSEWMLISILGVLKSGGAYVPIDPEYPQDRIEYIEKDTNCKVCIDEEELNKFRRIQEKYSTTRVKSEVKADNLAYVIYTSGSTGKPKGVMIEHRNLVNYLEWYTDAFQVVPTDSTMAYAKFGFDASVGETLTYLTKGACVHIAPQELLLDIQGINGYYESNNITIAFLPTPVCQQFMHLKNKSLRCLTTGGDRLIQFVKNNYKLINNYGPTETTVVSTSYEVNESKKNYPIGRPIHNTEIHILSESLNLLPEGVIGEICIGGAGLARGYLNQESLTKEKFIPHPFKEGSKLYRTGDLGRWLADGNIEFIRRKDDQVKIHGYRIELGEIESALSQIEGIKQACVLVKEKKTDSGSNKYLVGYYILDNSIVSPDQTTILEKLSGVLPEYMIPSVLIPLEFFPLTNHGKLDKKALPDPEFSPSEIEHVAPTTEIEKTICEIWQNVLGIDKIGVTDDFFTLGGNSILAIHVSHRMNKLLGCEVKVADIFKHKTISQLVIHATGQSQIIIPKVDSSQSALSFAQERLWFIEQYEGGTNAYHVPEIYELGVDTDKEGIKYALQQIVSRHEVLRSTIEQGEADEHGIQVVHDDALLIEEIKIKETDDYESMMREEINRPFNLGKEYPIRVKFYTIESSLDNSESRTLLLINTHHIASDGWSTDIFKEELLTYYEAYINNDKSFSLAPLEIQYKDYSLWQRSYLTGETLDKQLSYWKNKLSGYQTLEFPTDYARPSKIDYRGASQSFSIGREVSQKLRALAQKNGVSLNSLMLAAFNVLLGKYTGQQDIVVGSPSANRHHRQTEALIGFFVNTQVNRTQLSNTQSFEELIREVHQEQIEVQSHQDLPFEKLVDQLKVERDTSRHPIFQIIFEVVQGFDTQNKTGIEIEKFLKLFQANASYEVERFDLSVFIDCKPEELVTRISYAKSLYRRETIERLMRHYNHLLDQLTEAPSKPYSQISLLNDKEYDQIIYEWNNTDKDYPSDKTMYELFQAQAAKTPDNVALVCEGQELSYRELNEKSNQLARYIRAQYKVRTNKTLGPDTLIALCLERSLEMVVGILGVLKAGGAYVPMDPSYPQERLDYILDDTKAEFVLSQRQLLVASETKLRQEKILYIDLAEELYKKEDVSNLSIYSKSTDLAYVIYTSGTTGKPKGVMVGHKAFVQFIYNFNNELEGKINLIQKDVLSLTNYVFDIFGLEYALPLMVGSKIILSTINEVKEKDISSCQIIQQTPGTLFHLVDKFPGRLSGIVCLVGGEALPPSVAEKLVTSFHKVINVYGPAETVIWSSSCEIKDSNKPYIGTPLLNEKMYVLDMNRAPVPIGVIGELYIGGAGLARGYLNRAELTSERFIKNPFATDTDKQKGYDRLYKTGDLVRWLPDGNIEYIGRNDDQVKIRGYRIELGEIESALSQIGGIKQSCVLVKEKQTDTGINKYLVGYYVLDNDSGALDQTLIQEKLSQSLPEYMIPSALVMMESFPLTINGKLDKKALPDPEFINEKEYVKPETELEIKLCSIYAGILGLRSEQISIHQSFFNMGGNSILSISLKQKLNQLNEFKSLSIADLFKYNSIRKLIESISTEAITYKFQQKRNHDSNHEIAIIGMSGAFSGVSNIEEFWQLIKSQEEGVQFYSKEECSKLGVNEELIQDPNFIAVAGTVKNIELFDPGFWEISPNEAKQLDPQIRKFIEHSWYALESSGYAPHRKNHNIGVFAGSGNNGYFYENILNGEMANKVDIWEVSNSNSKDALATKTAFFLGLSGPAISINTACSTGLVSVVEACKNLQVGACNMALAGGVRLVLPDEVGYVYHEGMILSKDGHSRTFDKKASGTIAGSGVGVILLKRLEDAEKDGDVIIGVIKGYATNNDGDRKTGYTAPSVIGQSECIINAQRMAGVNSDEIAYVECHGTATHLGDPIEVQALREAFVLNCDREKKTNNKTILGSVKANIGHTDSAAGIAGLIKVCSMLQNNIIPGQVNFDVPNAGLQLEGSNFEITKENITWVPTIDKQRFAAVSSFGIGGTNSHVIIGDYVSKREENNVIEDDKGVNFIIPLSAKKRHSLEQNKNALLDYLIGADNNLKSLKIAEIAYNLQERREQFNFRSAYCAKDIKELINKLKEETIYAEVNIEDRNKIVFMFPGQYIHMAKELYDNEQNFKNTVDRCIKIANKHLSIDLFDVMYPVELILKYDINEIQWSPISLFIIEYSLSEYLNHVGVKADAYIGHSFGEYVAATLSGVFSLEDAISIVITRSKLMQSMQPGSMIAVNAEENVIRSVVKEFNCEVSLINSADDFVVSGSEEDIKKLQLILEKRNIPVVKINGSVAGHSKLMDQAAQEFEKAFKNIQLNKPIRTFASNLTGKIAKEEVATPRYWCKQLRNTVQFAEGIETLSNQFNYRVSFIEVGTGKGLSYFINKYKNTENHKSIQSLQLLPSAREVKSIEKQTYQPITVKEELMAKLWMNGIIQQPNELNLFKKTNFKIDLPVYQFDFQKCWLEKGKVIKPGNRFTLLPSEKWLSKPVWSEVSNLNENKIKTKFQKSLIFIREDQVKLFDFYELSNDIQFVVLDLKEVNGDGIRNNEIIRVNPSNESHFEQLAGYFKTNRIKFDAIIHTSSINNSSHLEDSLLNSFYSLFLIRQFLLDNSVKNLLVLTNGLVQITNDDVITPANGTLVGGIRNINHEFLDIDAKVIDVGNDLRNITKYVAQVVGDSSYHKYEDLLAFKFGKLWIQNLRYIENAKFGESDIEDGDTILITGGLGGVGLAIAEYISAKHRVNLILLSRRNIFDVTTQQLDFDQKVKALERIKLNGSSVDTLFVDVSDATQLRTLINKAQSDYGKITGIVHTAGIMPINKEDYCLKNIKDSFKGKVYGIDNIINSVNLKYLKFIASTSSIASILGDVSRIEYCASNSFLDYLAVDKKRFGDINVSSINLPSIIFEDDKYEEQLILSKKSLNASQRLQELLHLNSFTHKENAEWFYRIINQRDHEQIIVSKYDIYKLRNELFKQNDSEVKTKKVAILEENYTEVEDIVAQIFGDILGIDQVSLTDDFFTLGGNSILAIHVSHRMNKLLGCEVKVADIFKHKTISQLVIHATGQSQIIIPKVDSSQSALSFAQERLWFIEQYEGGTNAYHVPEIYELGVDTDKEGIKYALQQIVSRHEVLRSTIEQGEADEHGIQVVHDDALLIEEIKIKETDDYESMMREEINRPFNLGKEYPIRVKFYTIESSLDNSESRTLLLINTHHIASDGWSTDIFKEELLTYYEAYINNDKSFSLAPLEIQYKDYSLWQRSYLTGETLDKQLSYWKNKLSGYQTLEFPTDYARPSKIDYRGASQSFSIGREVSQKLRALAQKNGVSLNSLMLAAFNVLLGKYTGQQDIVVGSPSANRHHRQTEALIGFFVNTQVNRTQLSNTQSFEELIREVHQEQIEVQSHQDLPFEKLVDQLKVERDTSRHPIFQIIFEVVQGFDTQNKTGIEIEKFLKLFQANASYEVERFDLSVFIDCKPEELVTRISYAKSLYRRETIERLMRHYNHLLDQLTEAPSKPYSQISLLNDKEYDQIIYEWNNTDKDYPSDKTIVDLFENQVSKNPENVAIVFEGKEITYRQLNEQSDKLANYLRANCNVRANDLVGLMLGRSENMLIAIMGILKAGGAYVCIDPEYPEARKQHIIEDTNINMLITQVDYLFNLEFYTGKLFAIDLELDSIDNSATFLKAQIKPNHLAYVIYTSGTTGKPKGVMVDHHSVINYVNNVNEIFSPEIMNVDFSTNPVFDLTVTTTICSLLLGKKIIVFSGSLNDTDSYVQHLVNNKIDFIKSTPSLLSNLPLDRFTDYKIKQAFIGGEKLEESQLVRISKYVDHSIDEYGPTEATVGTTYMKKSIGNVKGIGKPYFNYKVYILDMNRAPVPIGVIGELYIGGAGLARGYLNRAELTSERFIKNPFATDTDKQKGYDRLYKTGDLVRWLPDGNIEYIGRNDDQVKIRGYRIELGEIESALSQIGGIKQSCVLVKEKQTDTGINKYLVGYYVLDNDSGALDQTLIQEKLSQSLPEYMIPSALVMMESFPLTINGKLDKKALPDPEFSSEDNYVAPNTEIEKTICGIWQNVLGLEKIGVTDDFFRIGGDSILSMQVSSRIRQSGFACQVKDVFEYKTISRLAEHLSKKNSEINIKAEQDILTGELDLLPIQQWFLEKVENEELAAPNHWNQSFLIRVPSLDIKKLESVIEQLVSYHDVLRIRYTKEHDIKTEKNNWKQVYQSNIFVPDLKTLDVSAHTEDEVQEILTVWQSGFDLEEGSLFQVGYLYGYKDGSARIYFALHHMIVDGVSWRILTEDIRAIYEGKKLSPKGSSYRQWVASVKKYTEEHSLESVYWENQLKGMPNYHLTVRHQEPSIGSFELNKIVTKSLLQEASKAYHTEVNDLLLTALAYALKEINHQDIQGITLEGHGREDIDLAIDHSRTVGWFTTLFPVRLEIKNNFKESIQFIKEKLRTIPNKGIGFGAFATSKEINYTYKDLVPISFNYLGQFDTQQGDWQIISENSGDNMRLGNTDNNIININGHVSNGKLGFSIVTKLGETTTKILSDSLKLQLIKIVEHCIETIEREESRYTPSDFNSVKISQSLLDQLEASAKQIQNKIQHIYPANSLQQGFIYHALSQGEDDAYRVQILFDYHEALDAPLYIKSWECCIAQYPALRTAFNWEEDLIQLIYRRGKLNYQLHDISHLVSQQERDAAIEVIQLEDRKQGFDLAQPTLFRLHIIKQSPVYYTVLKTEHHSIADGWSGPVLLSSLHHYYQELKNNKEVNIKEETAYLRTQEYIHKYKNTAQGYWEERLSGVDGANDIAALLSKSTDISNYKQVEKPTKSTFEIKGEFYKQLKAFTSKEGITTNVVVQFIWHKLLQVYSSSLKSIVGTTISGRDLPIDGIEESVGLYINTLPLIIDWENDNAILDQLHQIQRKITEINTHSFVDLVKLQTEGERIFQSLFVYENYPAPKEGSDGLEISFRNAIEKTDYPLTITAFEHDDSVTIDLEFDDSYLTEDRAKNHLTTLGNILHQVLANPGKSHNQISLIGKEEYDQIIYEWNNTDKDYPSDKTMYELFQAQAAKTPDNVALVCEGQELSYRELNEKSNQLARYIRAQYKVRTNKTLGPDTLIALCLERSLEMVVGILGVLKAGGAYVPMDPSYPQERLDYILDDTKAELVLSQRQLLVASETKLPQEKILYIDLAEELYKKEDVSNLSIYSKSTDLAYVIYTSGTTGRPKGALIEHVGMINHMAEMINKFNLNGKSRLAQNAPQSFDISVWQMLTCLICGGRTVIYSNEVILSPNMFIEKVSSDGITVLQVVPSYLTVLLDEIESKKKLNVFQSLKHLITTGETIKHNLVSRWFRKFPLIIMVNAYGPAEASDDISLYFMDKAPEKTIIPVGQCIQNLKIYIVDNGGILCPIGVIGEIWVSGVGIGRGYLNDKKRTDKAFITDPFNKEKKVRLYKTGDIGRYLHDGCLEYIGRNDDQVKIRGYRIELGEIEHVLNQIDGIKESCVLARERKVGTGSVKYLVGYYELEDSERLLTSKIIEEKLSQILPEYMIPSALVMMESFPLTINGKLDKKALPDPEFGLSEADYVAPATEMEVKICAIWQDVLGLERVGLTDNFFRIGGNSILAIQIIHRINKTINSDLKVSDMFKYPTCSKLLSNSSKNNVVFVEGEL